MGGIVVMDTIKYNLQLAAEVADLQQDKLRHEAAMKQLETRLVTSNTKEEATAARLQLSQATQANAGGSFPVGFGSVEQQQCLDHLGVATQQLAAVLAAREGAAALVSIWDRDSCAAALHHQVLNTALGIAQQQVDWYADRAPAGLTNYLACLTSCPEAGCTELHAVLQQLQQAKSRTLFLVAQQQATSNTAAREVLLVALAAAMTRVNLLLASLQSSCPGLQLVCRLEDRPLFLVRPGLVCAAAGGGRQVLVRQQAVALVPDLPWLALQCQLADEQLQAAKLSVIQAHRRQCEAAHRKEEADQCLRRCAEQHEGGRQQQQQQHEGEPPGAEEKQASTEMVRQRLLAEQSVEDGRRQLEAAARQQQRVKQHGQQAGHKVGKANAMGFQKPVVRNRMLKGRP
ncbi:hypothetical protein HaLaN_13996 [Haematococcus lacustris]|uniref:Uncharacterized protein n=1 Tax=Haematococcus lacustris TaxID=44745 RepID=A0A699Z5J6_HAELA|nr:hypothetical protein HaLaN_13996 [Haematococcus lacustris]